MEYLLGSLAFAVMLVAHLLALIHCGARSVDLSPGAPPGSSSIWPATVQKERLDDAGATASLKRRRSATELWRR